jgi:hypothetical protein
MSDKYEDVYPKGCHQSGCLTLKSRCPTIIRMSNTKVDVYYVF